MSDTLIIIPTYKEKENIERMVRKIFSFLKEYHILVVDDNSPDGTADIVRGLLQEFKGKLFLETRLGKLGLGTAYIHGFKWALARDYQYVFELDADFSHDPNDIIRLYKACAEEGNDLAIGSRYILGVNVVNWPMGRVLMSYWASAYVRFVTRMKIRDTTAGFKCYKREVLEAIDLDGIQFTGYAFQIEMKFLTWKLGFKIKEVSIIFTERAAGVSKMTSGIFREAVFGIIKLRWQSLFKKYERLA